MKTLEQEAEEYAEKVNAGQKGEIFDYAKLDFVAGANSKWVQAQIINAKIDGLLLANDNGSGIMYRIEELEEKLKQLSNTCTCGRREINTLSGICDECWNEIYPDEKVELKD
jgi:hypothetical protein